MIYKSNEEYYNIINFIDDLLTFNEDELYKMGFIKNLNFTDKALIFTFRIWCNLHKGARQYLQEYYHTDINDFNTLNKFVKKYTKEVDIHNRPKNLFYLTIPEFLLPNVREI